MQDAEEGQGKVEDKGCRHCISQGPWVFLPNTGMLFTSWQIFSKRKEKLD